jgi:hypothetical protein
VSGISVPPESGLRRTRPGRETTPGTAEITTDSPTRALRVAHLTDRVGHLRAATDPVIVAHALCQLG